MNYIILVISLCLGVSKNLVSKAGKTVFDGISNLMSANIITATLALVVFSIGGLNLSNLSIDVVLLALVYGLFTMGAQSLYILAVKNGSVSICSLVYASCFLIPTFFSIIVYDEPFSILKIVGIAVMLISILMVSYRPKSTDVSHMTRLSWYLIICSMISAGGVGILQKIVGNSSKNIGQSEFLFLSFGFMLMFSLLIKILNSVKNKEKFIPNQKSFFLFAALLAVSQVIANRLNIFLVGVMPGMIFFPVINGGTIIASSIGARVIFKEKLAMIQILGIAIGVAALFFVAV